MFPGAVIRKLAFSEEIYARYQAFTSFTAHVRGPVDIDAMSEAFDALLQAHPVFAAHLEEGPDGNHHIVANDLLHSGWWSSTAGGPKTRMCSSISATRCSGCS